MTRRLIYPVLLSPLLALALAAVAPASSGDAPRPAGMTPADVDRALDAHRRSGRFDVQPWGRVAPAPASPLPPATGLRPASPASPVSARD
jgi:hypothetical protein